MCEACDFDLCEVCVKWLLNEERLGRTVALRQEDTAADNDDGGALGFATAMAAGAIAVVECLDAGGD